MPLRHDLHPLVSETFEQQAAVGHDPQAGVRDGLPEDDLVRDRPDGGPPSLCPRGQQGGLGGERRQPEEMSAAGADRRYAGKANKV